MDVNPYLNFSGNCEEAFEFYAAALGGEVFISRFSEMPADEGSPPIDGNLIMHVSLDLGKGQVLMGSDIPDAMGDVKFGNFSYVSIGPDSAEDAKRIFDALAEGGTVQMPFQSMFWGADYGMLTDKFGVGWMVNYTHEQHG